DQVAATANVALANAALAIAALPALTADGIHALATDPTTREDFRERLDDAAEALRRMAAALEPVESAVHERLSEFARGLGLRAGDVTAAFFEGDKLCEAAVKAALERRISQITRERADAEKATVKDTAERVRAEGDQRRLIESVHANPYLGEKAITDRNNQVRGYEIFVTSRPLAARIRPPRSAKANARVARVVKR
ncbi:MAG: hypothetical protein ACREVG_02255, partial [Burkholderiales bacterium]